MKLKLADSRHLFCIILAIGVITIAFTGMRSWYRRVPIDFRAFYAAGCVVLQHKNPYLTEPLFGIEQKNTGPGEVLRSVDPVPLPPYDLAFFSLLARLSSHVAAAFYGLLVFVALGVIAYALCIMRQLPIAVALSASCCGIVFCILSVGQIAPLAIASIAAGSYFLRFNKPILAGVFVSIALIQPQIAIPSLISCVVLVPRTRVSIIAMTVLLIAVSLSLGTTTIMEFATILRLQAEAELASPYQYSFSWLLSRAGAPNSISFAIGTLSYIIFLIIGLVVLARHRSQAIKSGAVVLLPAALAVCGGAYIHLYQVEVGLLSALVLARERVWRLDASIAAGLLITPFFLLANGDRHWLHASTIITLAFSFATVWVTIYYIFGSQSGPDRSRNATIYTGFIVLYFLALLATRPALLYLGSLHAPPVVQSNVFASESFRRTVLATQRELNNAPWAVFVKLPTWFAIAVTVASSVRSLRKAE